MLKPAHPAPLSQRTERGKIWSPKLPRMLQQLRDHAISQSSGHMRLGDHYVSLSSKTAILILSDFINVTPQVLGRPLPYSILPIVISAQPNTQPCLSILGSFESLRMVPPPLVSTRSLEVEERAEANARLVHSFRMEKSSEVLANWSVLHLVKIQTWHRPMDCKESSSLVKKYGLWILVSPTSLSCYVSSWYNAAGEAPVILTWNCN